MLSDTSKHTSSESLPDALAPELIQDGLATSIIAKDIYYFESIDSTNRIAKEYAQTGASDGALVVAEEQTGGRGRLNRTWISPAGSSILCSCIMYPKISIASIFRITMLASLGVVRAIDRACGMEAQIKWPNDVYINEKKVCGILTEFGSARDKTLYAVVGIGLNVNFDIEKCPEISDSATSLRNIRGSSVARLPLFKALLEELDKLYLDFMQTGSCNVRSEWERHSMILNRPVEIICGDETMRGIARGFNEDGHLLLEDSGVLKTILCGDVSLRLERNA
ncbi:MAG: biotin--[acetyl-CoA-carboxylase] ligase [Pseudomonadota bacterium]